MEISPRSPRNHYRAEITYDAHQGAASSMTSVMADTEEDVVALAEAEVARIRQQGLAVKTSPIYVNIKHNKADYPAFDWESLPTRTYNFHGGARQGAGRKRQGAERKQQVTVTLTADQAADLRSLRERGVDVNKAIGKEVQRLAIAYDLSDLGIV